jgi:hypothetical protein
MTSACAVRGWLALAVLVGTAACGREPDQSIGQDDLRIVGERVEYAEYLMSSPVQYVELALAVDREELGKSVPLTQAEAEVFLSTVREFSAKLQEEPRWKTRDGPMTPGQRAREESRIAELRTAAEALRRVLAPHRAWLEARLRESAIEFFDAPPGHLSGKSP